MAKIERKMQKIFAGNSNADQIAALGTMKTSSPTYTTNLDTIQNTNFLGGWSTAIVNDKAPWLEEMNAVQYSITRQLAYLFQQGIAEWDSGTEYAQNSIVANGSKLYISKTNANIGNALTETTYWTEYDLSKLLTNRQYVDKYASVGIGTTSLTSYLPNNSKQYLVWARGYISGSNGDYTITATSDIASTGIWVAGSGYDSGRSDANRGSAIIPVGTGRTINFSKNGGNASVELCGYVEV